MKRLSLLNQLLALALCGIGGFAPSVVAQTSEPSEIIRVDSDLVDLKVSVLRRDPLHAIGELRQSDFVILEDGKPQEIAFFGNVIRMYYPKLKMYQDYDVGKNADVLNQYLLLGFGSSGKELAQSYEISAEGTEKVAGTDTTKLLLVPKSAGVKEHLSKIEMWIPANAAYPIQQQFYEPTNGNYRRVTYSNVKLNPSFKGNLELKLPSGVKRRGP